MPQPNLFSVVLEVALSRGLHPLTRRPGCTEVRLGEGWCVLLNPHATPTDCPGGNWVPPYTAVVQYVGFPVGVLTDDGCAVWLADVEDEAAAALQRELELACATQRHGGLNG